MVEITWLGHSTFKLRLPSGEVVLLDPWAEGNPAFPSGHAIGKVDIILISHGHFDHIHDAVPLAKQHSAQAVGIYEICHWLERQGVREPKAMNKGGSQKVGPLTVTMTHAVHSCGILDNGTIIYGGEACGYVLGFEDGRKLYFAGDTNVFTDMQLIAELYRPELALLPIGDLFTMSPREAALACRLLKPKRVIPMHWGTFPALTGRPEQLAELIGNQPETEVWTLTPGVAVQW